MDSAAQPAEMASQPQPPSPPGQESDVPRPADRSDQDLNTMNADLDRGSTPHNNPAMESSTSPLVEQEEPEKSEMLEEPETSEEPQESKKADELEEPEESEEPKKQDNPGEQEGPEKQEKEEKPEEPEEPEKSEKPEDPAKPAKPEQQGKPETPEKPDPGLPPAQEAEAPGQTAVPGASQNPQPPLPAPDVPNQSAVERWRRHIRDKMFPQSKSPAATPTAALQKPDVTEAGSNKPADSQGEAATVEGDKAEAVKPEAKLPELPALVDLSKLPLPVLPSMDIIAVHDLGQSLTTAWVYTAEKAFAKRPGAPVRQPHVVLSPVSGLANSSQPLRLGRPTDFKATLKTLGEAKGKGRDIHGWAAEVEPNDGPAKSRNLESHEHAAVSSVPGADAVRAKALGEEFDVASMDKGKGRADDDMEPTTPTLGIGASGDGGERGRQPPAQPLPQPPTTAVMDEKKPHDDGGTTRASRQSDRPSSNTGSKQPSEKDKGPKVGNWLTDPTMLAGDLDRARVLAFSYKSLEPAQSPRPTDNPPKNVDYAKYLEEMAEALLSKLKAERADHLSQTPLVFIGTGFGCLIIQKLILLIAEIEGSPVLNMIAALHFFDAPSNILPEADMETSNLILPPPVNSIRAARVKAILESKTVDSWDLWSNFQDCIIQRGLSTVWYYTLPKGPSRTVILPHAAGVAFVMLEPTPTKPPAPSTPTTTTSRQPSRFRGPRDPNYRAFLDQTKQCLVLKASTDKGLEDLLVQFIASGYKLDVTDHRQRCPLHLAAECVNDAALSRLVSARPDLVVQRDGYGSTPLHVVVMKAVTANPKEDDRAPFRAMIQKLLYALAENQHEDNLEDFSGRSPWEYAGEANYGWIRELREFSVLVIGAHAARPETIEDLDLIRPSPIEAAACRKSVATVAQLYIAKDGSKDYLELQRTDVYTVIYDEQNGVQKWWDRNLLRGDDKRATCRWIHLPANNERWVYDLFGQQLRRIEKSTSQRRLRGSAPFDRYIDPDAFRYKQTYLPRAAETPFPSPAYTAPSPSFSVKSSEVPGSTQKTVTALFMPIFGFETHENRKRLTSAMKEPSSPGTDETSRLIRAYFENESFPLHCRRTLDQFTYHMLKDTERRDNTQVMFNWTKRDQANKEKTGYYPHNIQPSSTRRRRDKGGYPLLMVDQLWMWILEDDHPTVIMSVPNTWESAEDYNLVSYLIRHKLMNNNGRPLIEGPVDLANAIIQCSVDFLHRPGPLGVRLYDCFQSSITLIGEKQAIQFRKFKLLVKDLSKEDLDQRTRNKLTNKLFRLKTETRLLEDIMDIQDELKTIQGVLVKQRDVLYKFLHLLSNDPDKDTADDPSDIVDTPESSQYGSPTLEEVGFFESPGAHVEKKALPSALYRDGARSKVKRNVQFVDERVPYHKSKSWKQAKANLDLVRSNIDTIKEMTHYAGKVQVEINGLLSHRQKQANAWEARFAREGSEHTQRQSNITLVFTIVTVFFLPLSFMSSVFAIQIDAFPHDPETGEVNWPVGEAMGLIFGIALGMILLIAFVGFYVNRISHFFTEHFGRASLPRVPQPDAAHPHESSSDSSDDSDTTTRPRTRHRRPDSTEPSRRPQDKVKVLSEANTLETLDLLWSRNRDYAPLFGHWHFHERIPLARRLWEYHFYYSAPMKKTGRGGSRPSTSTTSSSHDAREDGGRRRAATASSWGGDSDDFWGDNVERDYALHRARVLVGRLVGDGILRPMRRLVPSGWRGKSGKEEPEAGDEEVGYDVSEDAAADCDTIRPSMQRSSGSGTVDSWWVPEAPVRRRRTQERQRRGSTSVVAGFVSRQWRETVGSFGARRNAPTVTTTSSGSSGGSFATSVGVAFASDDDSVVSGRGGGDGEDEGAQGKKGVGFAAPVWFFARRKAKTDDLESNRQSEE